jgi:glutathione S-transferase
MNQPQSGGRTGFAFISQCFSSLSKGVFMPVVHGASVSPFVRKVRVALKEKGVSYEQKEVIPFGDQPELLAMNPMQKIPVYQDGNFKLPDSSVILQYLDRTHPTPALYPSDTQQYAWSLFLEEYADTRLVETVVPFFVERWLKKHLLGGQPADEERLAEISKNKLPATFDWLQSQVTKHEWAAGNSFGAADIAIAAPFVNFSYAGEKVDPTRWPKLAAYVERVWARPSFKDILDSERKALGL